MSLTVKKRLDSKSVSIYLDPKNLSEKTVQSDPFVCNQIRLDTVTF